MEKFIARQAAGVVHARQRAQSIVEVVLAVTAMVVAGAAALAIYTGALQQAFERLVTRIAGI
jgi:hypothetical protein